MDRKFMVSLGPNGSVNVVPEDRGSPVTSAVLLLLVFALTLSLNVFLAGSLSTGSFSRFSFNLLLLQLAIVGALDSVNVLGSLVLLLLHPSPTLCRLDAMSSQLVAVLHSWVVATLSADSAYNVTSASLEEADNRSTVLTPTLKKVLPVLWIYAVVLVLPMGFVVETPDLLVFPDRSSCGSARPVDSVLYPCLLFALGHGLPWAITATCLTSTLHHVTTTRSYQKKLARAAEHRRVLTLTESGGPREGFAVKRVLSPERERFNTIIAVMVLLYGVLLVPHILSVTVSQFTPSPTRAKEIIDNTEVDELSTGMYDVVFIWCRYSADILEPLVLFIIHKDVRKKCEALFCCYCLGGNAVLDAEEERVVRTDAAYAPTNTPNKKSERKSKANRVANPRTPVLYSTSAGLHLRTLDDEVDAGGGDGGAERLSWAGGGQRRPKYRCEFCDLVEFTPVGESLPPRQKRPPVSSKTYTATEDSSSQGPRILDSNTFRRKSEGTVTTTSSDMNRKNVRFAQKNALHDTFSIRRSVT